MLWSFKRDVNLAVAAFASRELPDKQFELHGTLGVPNM